MFSAILMIPAVWALSKVCLPCHFNMCVGYEIVTQWIAPAIPARFAALSGAEGLELDHEVAWTWLRAHFCTAHVLRRVCCVCRMCLGVMGGWQSCGVCQCAGA